MGNASSQPTAEPQDSSQETTVSAHNEERRDQAGSSLRNPLTPSPRAPGATTDVTKNPSPRLASPIRFTKRKQGQSAEDALGDGAGSTEEPRPRKKARARPYDPSLLKSELSNSGGVRPTNPAGESAVVPERQKERKRKDVISSPAAPQAASTERTPTHPETYEPSSRERRSLKSDVSNGGRGDLSTELVHRTSQDGPAASKPTTSSQAFVPPKSVVVRKPADLRQDESNDEIPFAEGQAREKTRAKRAEPNGVGIQTPPTSSQKPSHDRLQSSAMERHEATEGHKGGQQPRQDFAHNQPPPLTIPFSPDAGPQPLTSRDPNISRASRVGMPEPLVDGPDTGMFTDAEKRIADDVCEAIIQSNNHLRSDFFSWIGDWRSHSNEEFRNAISEALPNRTKAAVRKFCQRRYVPKTHGPWTPEEDEQLVKAHAELGEQWEEVRQYLNLRSAAQCRDRWRNHLQYKGQLVVGPWSVEEERGLVAAVHECLEVIRSERVARGDLVNPPDELEKLINWDTVSKNLGGKRGRKRCMEKWLALKRRNNGEFPSVTRLGRDGGNDDKENAEPQTKFNEQSKSQRLAIKQFKKFNTGDIYDALVEISTAINDHALTFYDESTLWSTVALRSKDSRFTSALRRRAYHHALEVDGEKKSVKKARTIAAKAEAMAQRLRKFAAKNGTTVEELPRGFQPTGKWSIKRKEEQMLSKERVEDSGDEAEVDVEATKQRQTVIPAATGSAPDTVAAENNQAPKPRFKKPKRPQAATEDIGDSTQDHPPKNRKKKRKSKEERLRDRSVPADHPLAHSDVVEVPETQEES